MLVFCHKVLTCMLIWFVLTKIHEDGYVHIHRNSVDLYLIFCYELFNQFFGSHGCS